MGTLVLCLVGIESAKTKKIYIYKVLYCVTPASLNKYQHIPIYIYVYIYSSGYFCNCDTFRM